MSETWTYRFNSALIDAPIEFQKSIVLFDMTYEYLFIYRKKKLQEKEVISDDSFVLQRNIVTGEVSLTLLCEMFEKDILNHEIKCCEDMKSYVKKKIKYLRLYDELRLFCKAQCGVEKEKEFLEFKELLLSIWEDDEISYLYNQICPQMLNIVNSISVG